jgi:hypothetical protein
MLIYKYTSFDSGKLILEHSSLRFSQVEALNDPFELSPLMDKYKRTLKAKARNEPKLRDGFIKMSLIEKEALIQYIIKPSIETVVDSIKNNLILSLTKKENNLLMWSHYADSHKGILIGFDSGNDFFQGKEHREMTCTYNVHYSEERPEFFDCHTVLSKYKPIESSVGAYRRMLLTKSPEWEYEQEVRMFALSKGASEVSNDNIYLFNFPKEALKKIVFGCQMSNVDKDELAKFIRVLYPNVELFEALLSNSKFDLKYKSFNT